MMPQTGKSIRSFWRTASPRVSRRQRKASTKYLRNRRYIRRIRGRAAAAFQGRKVFGRRCGSRTRRGNDVRHRVDVPDWRERAVERGKWEMNYVLIKK